jgi:WD40 repeat protein
VWDARTGQPVIEPLRHEGAVSAQFSPDGERVVTASDDNTARVWDARTGQPVTEPLRHKSGVISAQFSPDGERVVTASADMSARVWDARTGQPVTEPLRHDADPRRFFYFYSTLKFDPAFSAKFSPDGQRVVTASEDKTARVWDAYTGQPVIEPLRHEDDVSSAQFSPDGQRVVTASKDNTARVWDVRTAQHLTEPLLGEDAVSSAQFSSDGLRVVTVSQDKTARVWDARTGQPVTAPLHHEGRVISAQFSPDGQWVVTASEDKTARVWDAHTGQPITEPLHHKGSVFSAQFSPDGLRVVTVSQDKTARVWDARTGQPITESLPHESYVYSAQFSPDGQRVVTASEDGTARVWDARTGLPITEPLRHEGRVNSVQFSPDGQRVVTASYDKTARVWDARTGQAVTEPLRHAGIVFSAQFSRDGLRVVTASEDKTARVWDVRTGQAVTEPLRQESGVLSAQFSPDGQRVVTASYDKTARVWDAPVAPLPVPNWFIEWAEVIGGRRFDQQGADRAIPTAEERQWRNKAAARTGTDFFTRLVQWFEEDPGTRSISPFSSVTAPECVKQRIKENTLLSLREAVILSPTNALAFARLATVLANQGSNGKPGPLEEAEFCARYALKQDANTAEAWRTLGAIQLKQDRAVEARQSLERALEQEPGSAASWELMGEILEKNNQLAEAVSAYGRRIDLLPITTNGVTLERKRALLNRARVFKRLNRLTEAVHDTCAAYGIPNRQEGDNPHLVDLSAFYNAGFKGNWHADRENNDLSELPTGVQKFANITFDVRGLIQVGNGKDETNRFPDSVSGLPVNGKLHRIHLLHAAIWGFDPVGTVIGKYVIHYADGTEDVKPLVLGKDLLDWWTQPPQSVSGQELQVAWTGKNGNSREQGTTIQLYKTTWENPRPDAEIVDIDLISAQRKAAPFLVAITVE